MSRFHVFILLAIAIITTIRPTLAAEIDAGDFLPAVGTNKEINHPWSSYCSGKVKIIDDTSITLQGFNFSKAPWGQVIAFSKDPYEGKWPNSGDDDKPTKNVRPLDAIFVKEGIPKDDHKCFSFSDGDADDYKGTLKVKAVDGKKLVKETTTIGIYCLRFNVLFCKVDVTGKLDGITAGDASTAPTCSEKFSNCWKDGGADNEKCKERPVVGGGGGGGGDGGTVPNAGPALPVSSKWTLLLSGGIAVIMLIFRCLMSRS